MPVKSDRRGIAIHVKGMRGQSGNVRAEQFAAERQHEAIVGQDFLAATCCDGNLLPCDVDRLNLGSSMANADRIEYLAKRDGDVAKIDLIVAHTNVVIGIAVDQQYLNFTIASADVGELARGADSGPQTCKSTAEHENARHLVHHQSENLHLYCRREGKASASAAMSVGRPQSYQGAQELPRRNLTPALSTALARLTVPCNGATRHAGFC